MNTKTKRDKTIHYETLVKTYVQNRAQNGEKITNAEIINYIENETGIILHESAIRIIINDLRNNDVVMLLLADTKGFFIGQTEQDVKIWISTHAKKIQSMQLTLRSIKRQLKAKKSFCEYLVEKF